VNSKYFTNLVVEEWIRFPKRSLKGSIVWKALVDAFPLVGNWKIWKIGNEWKVDERRDEFG
jgi:hypothetical protein